MTRHIPSIVVQQHGLYGKRFCSTFAASFYLKPISLTFGLSFPFEGQNVKPQRTFVSAFEVSWPGHAYIPVNENLFNVLRLTKLLVEKTERKKDRKKERKKEGKKVISKKMSTNTSDCHAWDGFVSFCILSTKKRKKTKDLSHDDEKKREEKKRINSFCIFATLFSTAIFVLHRALINAKKYFLLNIPKGDFLVFSKELF